MKRIGHGWAALILGCTAQMLAAAPSAVTETTQESMGEDEVRQYTFKRGVNISHWLSQNSAGRPFAAAWFDEEDVAWIAQQGFDHLRLPVDFRQCLNAEGQIDPARLRPIEEAIFWAGSRGLGVVLDAHFLPGADFNPVGGDNRAFTDEALQARAAECWRAVSRHFTDEGAWLRFEILNEPVAAENEQVNRFMRRVLAAIREANTERVVYVTSNRWSGFGTIEDVQLPDDPHVALTLHYYEPMVFTHQRAPWVGFKDSLPAVHFPGTTPDVSEHTLPHYSLGLTPGEPLTTEAVAASFAKVEAWRKRAAPNVEIYLGEFGVFRAAEPASQQRWIRTVVEQCEKHGWGWAVWDYQGGFAVRAPDGSVTPVLDALFRPTR